MKNKPKNRIRVPVVKSLSLGGTLHLLTFHAPDIARSALPGQFVFLKAGEPEESPLLKRAFSVLEADTENVSVYFEVKGAGTKRLAALRKGQFLSATGPLGKGFNPREYGPINVLVAGGCGMAPLFFLAKRLHALGKKGHFYFGARSKSFQPLVRRIRPFCDRLIQVTEDGTAGKKGLVTAFITLPDPTAPLFSCGPTPMLKAVAVLFPEARLALETRMACGLGICMGCAVKTISGVRLCCKEGPVFKASEVVWE